MLSYNAGPSRRVVGLGDWVRTVSRRRAVSCKIIEAGGFHFWTNIFVPNATFRFFIFVVDDYFFEYSPILPTSEEERCNEHDKGQANDADKSEDQTQGHFVL